VPGDVAGRVRLDEEVEVALVFIGGDGRVRADDFLGLAGDGSGEGDVLADWKAENVGFPGKLEAVAKRLAGRCLMCGKAYMAVLWERTVFSSSSNSWKSVGCSTLRAPTPIRKLHPLWLVWLLRTAAVDPPSRNKCYQQHSV
jgi:hypothetical protein